MTVVVADTSPLNYLVQIDEAELLEKLYGTIAIPGEVFAELKHSGAPLAVREWIRSLPPWVQVRPSWSYPSLPNLLDLDTGERAAIELAHAESQVLLLIDDAVGRNRASRLGIADVGTLGVLRLAAIEGFIELRLALDKLTQTNFRASVALIRQLIVEDEERHPTSQP